MIELFFKIIEKKFCSIDLLFIFTEKITTKTNHMRFSEHPKAGQEVRGFKIVKFMNKIVKQTNSKMFYLCLQNGEDKRLLRYNPTTKETAASFERHFSSFGGSSKGSFKTW